MSNGLFPIKCTSCGKQINHLYPLFLDNIKHAQNIFLGEEIVPDFSKYGVDDLKSLKEKYSAEGLAMTNSGIDRYCCRRMFVCRHVKE